MAEQLVTERLLLRSWRADNAEAALGTYGDAEVALAEPGDAAGMVRRIGMEWVGETEKYYGLRLQVFRMRPGDLGVGMLN
jgi:hypothetical protein